MREFQNQRDLGKPQTPGLSARQEWVLVLLFAALLFTAAVIVASRLT